MPQRHHLQAPPEDVVGLRLELNRTQRQNLKLSSKLAKAQQEARERCVRRGLRALQQPAYVLAERRFGRRLSGLQACSEGAVPARLLASIDCRMAEARRWQQAVEQQAGSIAELKVDLEAERRRGQEVEAALTAASEEVAATQQQATALMAQLGAAEAANAAANGGLGVKGARPLAVGWAIAAKGHASLWLVTCSLADRRGPAAQSGYDCSCNWLASACCSTCPCGGIPRPLPQARPPRCAASWRWWRSSAGVR